MTLKYKFLLLSLFVFSILVFPSSIFAAPNSPPTLMPPSYANITGWNASLSVNISSLGNPATLTGYGMCVGTTTNPTTCYPDPTPGEVFPGSWTFYKSGLTPGILYYFRGYATNATGIAYSSNGSFTTTALAPPGVTSPTISNITSITADATATVTTTGYPGLQLSRGVCYNTTGSPVLSDPTGTTVTNTGGTICIPAGGYGANTGPYYSTPQWLTPNTNYYIRAYVLASSQEPVYGNQWLNPQTTYSPTTTGVTFQSVVASGTMTSPSSCTISPGASSCNVNLSWSVTNPEGVPIAITASGMGDINVVTSLPAHVWGVVDSPQSGIQNVSVPYGGRTFYLYNNAKSLVPTPPSGTGVTVTSSCASGSAWNGAVCAVAPDLTIPSIVPNPAYLYNPIPEGGNGSTTNISITISEIAGVSTNGQITIRTTNAAAIPNSLHPSSSANWNVTTGPSPSFFNYYISKPGYVISANQSRILNLVLTNNSNGTWGTGNITATIMSGSGGDNNTNNNSYAIPVYYNGSNGPTAPAGVTATSGACGSGAINISWNAVSGATSYNILRSTTTNDGYTIIGTGASSPYANNSGLTPGTTYYYVVQTVSSAGVSGNSSEASAIAPVTTCVPTLTTTPLSSISQTGAQSGGTSIVSSASVTAKGVVWALATDLDPTITIKRGMTNDGVGTTDFTSTITGLTAGTSYKVRAYATGGGTGYGSVLTFGTIPPAPTNLTATPGACGSGTINLSWSPSPGATFYRVYRGTVPGSATTLVGVDLTSTFYNNTGLTPGTLYYYVVRAYSGNVKSGNPNSNEASAIVPPATCSGMSGTLTPSANSCLIQKNQSSCSINLTWNVVNPEISSGSAVTSDKNNTGNSSPNFTISPPQSTGTVDSGTKTDVSIPYGTRTFYLYNNGKSLVPTPPTGVGITVTASCNTGANLTWDNVNKKCIESQLSPDITAFYSDPVCIDTSLTSPIPVTYHWTAIHANDCSSPVTNLFPGNRLLTLNAFDTGSDQYTLAAPIDPTTFISLTHTIQCDRPPLTFARQYQLQSCIAFKKRPIYDDK